MNFTEVFLRRPVFATIINALIIVVGLLSLQGLTLREYPKVSAPAIDVKVVYPNASPQSVESEVTTPLEQLLSGIEGIEYTSSSSRYGRSEISLRFRNGVNMTDAKSSVREQLSMARSSLPSTILEPEVSQQANNNDAFFYVSLQSDERSYAELTHLMNVNLKNAIKTISGVANIIVYGSKYTMSVSLDRAKMLQYGIDSADVMTVIDQSNVSLPAGRYHQAVPITFDMSNSSVEDFKTMPIQKVGNTVVTLQDIANVELGSSHDDIVRVNGKPGVLFGVVTASDGNPLTVSEDIKKNMAYYQSLLPNDAKLTIVFDKSEFIRGSLSSIEQSIIEAILLVMAVVFLFLRNFRATIIPLVAIPISLIGVLSIMKFFGLSINTITLLALVLSIGMVVDDAIVVLENIHRHIEEGLSPLNAAIKGAKEISFAIIAMTLTLASVYAPVAFIEGTMGQVISEFAITLAGAVIISGIVAISFTPLLCAKLMKPNEHAMLEKVDQFLERVALSYKKNLDVVLHWPKTVLLACLLCVVACGSFFYMLPQEITPKEDRGVIGVFGPPIAGIKLEEQDRYLKQVEGIFKNIPESPMFMTFAGNWGAYIVTALVPWSERNRSSQDVVDQLNKDVKKIPTAEIYPWSWDTGIPGVERAASDGNGISFILRTTKSYPELSAAADKIKSSMEEQKKLFSSGRHELRLNYPGYIAQVDRMQLMLRDLQPSQVASVVEVMFDKNTNLEFKLDGIRYPITIQSADKNNHIEELNISNAKGSLTALSDFVDLKRSAEPKELHHYNQLRSTAVHLELAEGAKLSDAVEYIRKSSEDFPEGVQFEFTGEAQRLQESSTTMAMLLAVALIFIYCILAIQFESFVDPFIIMFTVPLAGIGALLMLWLSGGSLNVFTQIGLLTLIALITKHGILIVEFANQRLESAASVMEAVEEAASIRLRPILMTTGAMVLGAVPLVLATGAGAESRYAIGSVLVAGLLLGTFFTLFVIPSAYITVKNLAKGR